MLTWVANFKTDKFIFLFFKEAIRVSLSSNGFKSSTYNGLATFSLVIFTNESIEFKNSSSESKPFSIAIFS